MHASVLRLGTHARIKITASLLPQTFGGKKQGCALAPAKITGKGTKVR